MVQRQRRQWFSPENNSHPPPKKIWSNACSSPQLDHLWVGGLQIFFPQPKAYFTSMQAGVTEWGQDMEKSDMFFFHLRHCRGRGGKEPVLVALWHEVNKDAL